MLPASLPFTDGFGAPSLFSGVSTGSFAPTGASSFVVLASVSFVESFRIAFSAGLGSLPERGFAGEVMVDFSNMGNHTSTSARDTYVGARRPYSLKRNCNVEYQWLRGVQ